MTDRETGREKVLKGLMCHEQGYCEIEDILCPYYADDECVKHLCNDAIEILKPGQRRPQNK
jgi:hypothetical protein